MIQEHIMSKVKFFSDDFYFLTGMQASGKDNDTEYTFITTVNEAHIVEEKIKSSHYDNVFIFSFQNKMLLNEILKLDRRRMFKFIIIINTPMCTPRVNIGNWLVVSKFNTLVEIEQAITAQFICQPSGKPFYFTARQEYLWSLLRRGISIHEISRYLNLSPKTVYAERDRALRKISFKRENELVYLKYGHIFHG